MAIKTKNADGTTEQRPFYYNRNEGFYKDDNIKALYDMHGDTGTAIYERLCDLSIRNHGWIFRERENLGMAFIDELAALLERKGDWETVRKVIDFCFRIRLLKLEIAYQAFSIPLISGSKIKEIPLTNAERQAKHRANVKSEAARLQAENEKLRSKIEGNAESDSNSNEKTLRNDIQNTESDSKKKIESKNSYTCSLNSVSFSFEKDEVFGFHTFEFWGERSGNGYAGAGGAAEAAPVPAAALTLDDWREINKVGKVGLNEAGLEAYYKETLAGKWFNQEIPLKGLRGWAKKFRKNHPEWFSSTHGDADQVSKAGTDTEPDGDADQVDTEPDTEPIWTQDDAWSPKQGKIAFDEILKEAK